MRLKSGMDCKPMAAAEIGGRYPILNWWKWVLPLPAIPATGLQAIVGRISAQ